MCWSLQKKCPGRKTKLWLVQKKSHCTSKPGGWEENSKTKGKITPPKAMHLTTLRKHPEAWSVVSTLKQQRQSMKIQKLRKAPENWCISVIEGWPQQEWRGKSRNWNMHVYMSKTYDKVMSIIYTAVLLRKRWGFADGKDFITIMQQKDRVLQAAGGHPHWLTTSSVRGHGTLQCCHVPKPFRGHQCGMATSWFPAGTTRC